MNKLKGGNLMPKSKYDNQKIFRNHLAYSTHLDDLYPNMTFSLMQIWLRDLICY
jgi:hypothetical protein